MSTQSWTDSTLGENVIVKDTHFRELMDAINDWEDAYGITESHYTQSISEIDEYIDFTSFTEVDPGSDITVAPYVITVTSLPDNINTYVYKDFGVSGPLNRKYFGIGVNHRVAINVGSIDDTAAIAFWGLSNYYSETWQQQRDNLRKYLFVYIYRSGATYCIGIEEGHSGGFTQDTYTSLLLSKDYYISIDKNEKIGTYGRFTCYVYSDSARTDLLDTLQIDLHDAFTNYRYLYGLKSIGTGSTESISMTINNLEVPKKKVDDVTVDEMQNALDTLKTLVDADTFVWTIADEGTIIVPDQIDQLRTNMEYFQDNNCYLCHTCDSYSACSCNATCHSYAACSCNSTCYTQGCTSCNVACYAYSCTCNSTCYIETKTGCTCNITCYGRGCSTCYNICYGQTCSCNATCHGYVACSCDSSCYGYTCSKCDLTDYEYPWS